MVLRPPAPQGPPPCRGSHHIVVCSGSSEVRGGNDTRAKVKGADRCSHREWYGPWSPLVRPKLREDILDSLYALNGVAFDLDLQRPDLDGAWPMFSE